MCTQNTGLTHEHKGCRQSSFRKPHCVSNSDIVSKKNIVDKHRLLEILEKP